MSALALTSHRPSTILERWRANLRVATATARVSVLRYASNPIQLLRAPLSPVLQLAGFVIAYNISG
ncbi:MAG TPA: hypothetical protein VNZ55_05360, partial [Thermomicrobiales bacterium]|nr:hypothetical protein [Thermomicrobiales bacterium]